MSELASVSTSAAATRKSRGANPSADYKSLFLKSKDKYDRVSTDHTEVKANVAKAAAKHQKLREELDYLLDAIAAKHAQRAQIEQSHRDRALELEREAAAAVAAAAAARHHAASLAKRDRDVYDQRSVHRAYEGAEDYRSYSARFAEPSYPAFGSGLNREYVSPPPPPHPSAVGGSAVSVSSHIGAERYPTSEGSPREAVQRDPYATASYRHAPSHSPPSLRRPQQHELLSSPSRYQAHQRYRESTPPAKVTATKRPRPSSVERELLETGEVYDNAERDRAHLTKRARND